jgi:BirA family biotin operon repressor/biotin-[acetyl-CoA-carboxylase] ligase
MIKALEQANAGSDVILNLLKQHQGQWLSGQFLAERLAMTRSAIWKKIEILRKEGYKINSSPRKGYLLADIPDRMLIREIRDGLNTSIFGQRDIHCLEKTDSTNRRAKELAAFGAAEGVLVIAEEQVQGRGRLNRTWFAPAGENICVSLIIRPPLLPDTASRMSILAAVAATETLIAAAGLKATIKWPNDILVGSKKIGGILLEMSMEMDAVDYMVIGLGINVNTPADRFPAEFRSKATSVITETGKPFPRVFLLRRFLELLESWYRVFRESGFDPIIIRWKDLTDMLGRQVTIETINGSYSGKVTDLDCDGFLILRNDREGEMRMFSGDITIM